MHQTVFYGVLIFRGLANVNDPLNPVFLTSDPPNYSNSFTKISEHVYIFNFKIQNLEIENFEKCARQEILEIRVMNSCKS